jgi:hypothetical protein
MRTMTQILELVFGRKAKRPLDPPQRSTDVVPFRELPLRKRRAIRQTLDEINSKRGNDK